MDQNFSLMAQSRANYYTAGSPVQFVRVELLKGDTTGEVAVCLTFKNVGTEPLTGLVVHFKCKDAAGQVLCEDDFYYEQLNAQPGAVFGSDDAVYVSDTPVSSVEVEQDRAFLNGRGVDLRNYKRVRLNMPRVLPGSIAKTLQQRTGNVQLTCVPQDTEYGWFCACGAFHPNEENTTVCSECGGDRAGIKATLTAILEEARQAAERQQQEVNAVASSVAPAPAPAPQPQAQPAPAASDPRAMANAVQAAITGQQDIPPQSAYEPEQATAAFEPQGSSYADDDEDAEADATLPRAACSTMMRTTMRAPRCTIPMTSTTMTRTTVTTRSPKNAAATPMTTKPVRTTSWPSASSAWPRPSRPLPAP